MLKPTSYLLLVLLTCVLTVVAASGQAPPEVHTPAEVEDNFLQVSGAQAHFEASNKMSETANAGLVRDRVLSVPHFSGSFAFQGKTFPFTVVGQSPQSGQSTHIATQIIPISLYFEGYTDGQGNPMVLDMVPRIGGVLNSPNFRPAAYATGYTQFGDAVQRAQFNSLMS